MRGVITHISDQNRKTACITSLNKVTGTRVICPSRPNILVIQAHFFCVFLRFLTTTGQSFSKAVRIRPRYFIDGTELSGRPYALKYRSVLSCISYIVIMCHFRCTPFVHCVVLGWQTFNTAHSNRMSQRVHRGSGRFTSSIMITVSRMFQCRKCMWIPVLVSALHLHP